MRAILATTLLALSLSATGAKPFTYQNERFGTSATFPMEVFATALPPPENGDGMTWQSKDGATLAIYGGYNVLETTIDGLADLASVDDSKDVEITYRKVGDDWAVVSGIDGDVVFYHRIEIGQSGTIHNLLVRYPKAEKARYDKLVGKMAASLEGP